MVEDLSLILIFAAGLLSFLSPCVLPLIPSYLSILGSIDCFSGAEVTDAASTDDEQTGRKRFTLFITALCFVVGFSVVFIILSIIISATFLLMGGVSRYINIIAGIIVIILGLNILFDFLSFLNYEKRPQLKNRPKDNNSHLCFNFTLSIM